MSQIIRIEIPDVITESYNTFEELERNIYEDIIVSQFQKGHLTIRESAKLLGLTYEGFIALLGTRELPFITATPDELEESYQHFEEFMQNYQT